MKHLSTIAALGLATSLFATGCAPPIWTEMLGQSIQMFTGKTKGGGERVWITNPADNGCNEGCASGCCGGGSKGGALGGGGLFSFKPSDGSNGKDKLAYEVFANFLTQKKKMKVVETHRHNYATELAVDTHKKVETVASEGGAKAMNTSCEDLCLLDEAKKKKADKILVYHIIEITGNELTINFRLSDVPTGIIDQAQTIKIKEGRVMDYSYKAPGGGRGEE